jgi:hypothetical protein
MQEQSLRADKCIVDMHVFGALVITEAVGGPAIQMTWGRKQADCNNVLKDVPTPDGSEWQTPALNAAPVGSFHTLDTLVADFARIGFNETEMTALMGAHSFGKMHKYAGTWSPRKFARGYCGSDRERWGDGGFWDRTPDVLDNDYFKLLSSTNADDKQVCCGPRNRFGCWTTSSPMEYWNKTEVPGQGCRTSWCMRSATQLSPRRKSEADWAMVSTQISMPQWNESKFGNAPSVRLFLLAADWALLENQEAKKAVDAYAKSQHAFHHAYAQAFSKLIALGYPEAGPGALKHCAL